MIMDLARKDFSTAPEYFIAGTDIGIAKATKTASAGQAVLTGLYGITADSAEADKEVPIYLTGEFFAAGLVLPKNVSVDDVEVPLRNLGIFLK